MADTLKVRAADPKKPVFMAGYERRQLDADGNDVHVIRDKWVEVPDTRFYRQRVRMGDLVEFSTMDAGATPPTVLESTAKEEE